MTKPRVFVSSTFVDLSVARSEICSWLTGLFGIELIVMESFGSDAAPPVINSVRRVRECDLFVGIYAHRYGTVDDSSGKSITELELDEAEAALSAGALSEILLFIIDEDSVWLKEFKENGPSSVAVSRLREKARRHTFSVFKGMEDLVFSVVQEVFKRIIQLSEGSSFQVRPFILQPKRPLQRLIGMEYLTSELREYLIGRSEETAQVLSLLEKNRIALLLGESGVGKTSLIHAGLIPLAHAKGWRVVYCRPYGYPSTDVARQLLASVFEGRPMYKGPLMPLIGEISVALGGQHLVIVIDQFEDILLSRDLRETENLLSDLRAFRNTNPAGVSILVSYRADLEGRLGSHWQYISGSPFGLSRFYLRGLDVDQAWACLKTTTSSLSKELIVRSEEIERIKKDLLSASQILGFQEVYPPYIQMTADHFCCNAETGKYHFLSYQKAGGMDGIIAGYLGRQLMYAQDTKGILRAVLISLVRSYGVKAQREIGEIVVDTGLTEGDCDQALERLIDLRLVRHIAPFYEISHDFIARRIANELVDSEELEFKRFRELLTSKTAAFQKTHSLLTTEEQLILYKHRQKIVPTDEESHLLLSTWVRNGGPGLYWLLEVDRSKMISWLRAEEALENIEAEAKASAVLLRQKLGESPLEGKDYRAFRGYQLSAEFASLILDAALSLPMELIIYGLRHRREEVRDACILSIAKRGAAGDWSWIRLLRKSSSPALRDAYEELVLRPEVPIPKLLPRLDKSVEEFRLLKEIANATSESEAKRKHHVLQHLRPTRRALLLARSLLLMKQERLDQLLRRARIASRENAKTILKGARCSSSRQIFKTLLNAYSEWNSAETGRYDRVSINAKAGALSSTIQSTMTPKYLPDLRRCFKTIRLTSSSREISLAFLRFGKTGDVKLVMDRIAKEKGSIDYWNHTELGRTAGRRMQQLGRGIPPYLKKVLLNKEFRGDAYPRKLAGTRVQDLLPLVDRSNRALYIRVAAYSAIGAATKEDLQYLLALSDHQYGLVARAAGAKLVRLFGVDALRMLSEKIDDAIQGVKTSTLSDAIRNAEMDLYGIANLN